MFKLSELKLLSNESLNKNSHFEIMGYNTSPSENTLCFVLQEKHIKDINIKTVSAIITTKELSHYLSENHTIGIITSPDPKATFWRLFNQQQSPSDYTKKNDISDDVTFNGPVHIADTGVKIGKNVSLGAFSVIHSGTEIGDNVTIGDNCTIGNQALQTFVNNQDKIQLVKHMGKTIIKSDVSIQGNVTISRGVFTYQPTIIGENCIIDNAVTIAHGVQIGTKTQIAPNAQILGRVIIGNNCFIAPSTIFSNNISIGNNCYILIGEKVFKSVPDNSGYASGKIMSVERLKSIIKK